MAACSMCLCAIVLAWSASAYAQTEESVTQAPPSAPPPSAPTTTHQVPAPSAAAEMFAAEVQLKLRLGALNKEEALLRREDAATHPLVVPVSMMIGGFGISAATVIFTLVAYNEPGHYLIKSRNPPLVSNAAAPALVGLAVLSGAVGVSGLIFTNYRLRHRPHSARLRELSTQNQSVRRQLKQVRRDLKREGWSLAPRLPVLSAGFGLQASCTF